MILILCSLGVRFCQFFGFSVWLSPSFPIATLLRTFVLVSHLQVTILNYRGASELAKRIPAISAIFNKANMSWVNKMLIMFNEKCLPLSRGNELFPMSAALSRSFLSFGRTNDLTKRRLSRVKVCKAKKKLIQTLGISWNLMFRALFSNDKPKIFFLKLCKERLNGWLSDSRTNENSFFQHSITNFQLCYKKNTYKVWGGFRMLRLFCTFNLKGTVQ